jgi:HAD superfamily hydrolase (TIGR01509 family)
MTNTITAVLFDMDGTVIDTEPIYSNAWRSATKELGLDLPEYLFYGSIGMNVNDMTAYFLNELDDPAIFPPLYAATIKYVKNARQNGLPVKKGFVAFSDYLLENGIRTAIVTSTRTAEAIECLKSAGIYGRFDVLVGFDDTETGKPTPLPYLEAVKRLNTSTETCVAFEDSPNGILSAASAGIRTVFIKDLVQPPDSVLAKTYARLESLEQAREFIQNLCRGKSYTAN